MKKRTIVSLVVVLFFFCVTDLKAQVSNYGSSSEIFELISKEKKKYQLKVTLPADYNSSESYKVLYYLDAWWLSESVLGAYALLHISQQVDPIILVGISLNGNEKDWNIQRTFDFTPSPYDISKMGVEMQAGRGESAVVLNQQTSGGADSFIEFLESLVFQFIEERYPSFGKSRGLLGHSYGGLFGFYVMQQKPSLFSNFILISPSLWWNKSELIKEEAFSKFINQVSPTFIYSSYGGLESKLITNSNVAMDKTVNSLKKESLNYKLELFEQSNHNSILPKAIYEGLLFVYGN